MPHLRHTSYDGYLESDEFIDLDRAFDQDGPSSPTSTTTRLCHYPPISFQSIDDEELRHFTRTLVTPRPHSNMPYTHRLSHQKGQVDLELASETGKLSLSQRMRSESVMLFHQIDNGDEDVSFDLVSSDLKDLIDYSLVPEMISRPASRTPFATQNYNR
ncbi:hypothetical protein BDF14DRAFT_1089894 [Spinellus fusiger]|nr:hypothetical protein BDF14DRAFT_1089894 [Spinellus fusiger]